MSGGPHSPRRARIDHEMLLWVEGRSDLFILTPRRPTNAFGFAYAGIVSRYFCLATHEKCDLVCVDVLR